MRCPAVVLGEGEEYVQCEYEAGHGTFHEAKIKVDVFNFKVDGFMAWLADVEEEEDDE